MKKISRLFLGIIVFFSIFIAISCSDDNTTKPIQVSDPEFSPIAGTYYRFLQVSISSETSGSIIRYTTDGSEPTESSPLYTSPIAVEKITTIKAMAFKENGSPSAVISANYNLVMPVIAALEFTPVAGNHNFSKIVEIKCATPGVEIFYTLDESEPSQMSEPYNSPIYITSDTTIKAKAFRFNHYPSQTLVGEYIIDYPAATNPSPADNASNIVSTPILSWETLAKKDRNLSFDLYFGTSANPILLSEHQTEYTYQTAELNLGTTYYWKVITHDGEIESESPVWSFSTDVPLNASPENDAVGVTLNPTLTWEVAVRSTFKAKDYLYDVYLGEINSLELVSEMQSEEVYTPPQLIEGTTYFWKIVVTVADLQVEGPIWQFTTNHAPEVPVNIFPENNAVDVTLHPTLRWLSTDARNSQSRNLNFDVYFGTSNNPELVADNQLNQTFRPNDLIEETTYYWKVVASDGEIEVESPVWSFTTGNQ